MEKTMEKIVSLAKARGFVYAGSEIYGGLANTWDYGPLGVELKKNIKGMWWKRFVQESPTNVGIDSAILMNPKVWEATGHVSTFNDPLIDCKSCKTRHRADHLIEGFTDDGIVITRSQHDAPEIDGFVYVKSDKQFVPGDIEKIKIKSADEYDLYGEV